MRQRYDHHCPKSTVQHSTVLCNCVAGTKKPERCIAAGSKQHHSHGWWPHKCWTMCDVLCCANNQHYCAVSGRAGGGSAVRAPRRRGGSGGGRTRPAPGGVRGRPAAAQARLALGGWAGCPWYTGGGTFGGKARAYLWCAACKRGWGDGARVGFRSTRGRPGGERQERGTGHTIGVSRQLGRVLSTVRPLQVRAV